MTLIKLSLGILLLLFGFSELMAKDLDVQIQKTKDWGSGFCANVYVSNRGDVKEKWEVSFNPKGSITTIWNAKYMQDSDDLTIRASGVNWNAYIKPNKEIKFGYCAKRVTHKALSPQKGDLKIIQTMRNSWNGGSCSQVKVLNTTTHPIDWNIEFVAKGIVTTLWNANYKQDKTNLKVLANGVGWNNIVQAHKSVEFGYCAKEISNIKIKTHTPKTKIKTTKTQTTKTTKTKTTKTKTVGMKTKTINTLFKEFNVGFGGSSSFPFMSTTKGKIIWVSVKDLVLNDDIEDNTYYSKIKDFNGGDFLELQEQLKKSKFFTLWFVKGWKNSWYDKSAIQKLMDAGHIPVISYWYFGDQLSSGMPNSTKQKAYKKDTLKVANFLSDLNGTKIILMEPEFNKKVVLKNKSTQHKFATIISNAIDTIKTKNPNILVSLTMMDTGRREVTDTSNKCGYANCSLGDKNAWAKPEIIYNDLMNKLDFISFSEMIGQFSRDYANPGGWNNPNPRKFTDENIGINFMAKRISNFSKFLNNKYHKPIYIPYMSIATATWNDKNRDNKIEDQEVNYNGWQDKAEFVYKRLSELRPTLQKNGLFGFSPMTLFDNPRHDYGGYQYFMNNEYHLGIIGSTAIDEVNSAATGELKFKGNILNYIYNL